MLITDRCSMRISVRSCRNMQQSIRSFMKMTWISILIPKSVQTSNFPDSKNGRSRRDRIKNIIWPERCTAGQVKSAMWAATAKVRHCSSAYGIGLKPHTVGGKPSHWSWTTTLSTKAGKHSAGWRRTRSSGSLLAMDESCWTAMAGT